MVWAAQGWYNVCWRVSCYFPGITLAVLTVLNLAIWHTGSSGAIPLGAFFSLVSLWFIVSTPLCYSGAPSPSATPNPLPFPRAPADSGWLERILDSVGLSMDDRTECGVWTALLKRTRHGHAGGMLAAKQEIRNYPTRTNQIPRHLPPPHWASHPVVLFLAAGLLPFGTIFVELYFAMTSIWQACDSIAAASAHTLRCTREPQDLRGRAVSCSRTC